MFSAISFLLKWHTYTQQPETTLKTNHRGPKSLLFVPLHLLPSYILLSKSSTSGFISASSPICLHLGILRIFYLALVWRFSVSVSLWLSPEHALSNLCSFLTLMVFPIHVSSQLQLSDWWAQRRKSPPWHFNLTVSTSLFSSKCTEIIWNSS